MGEQEPDLRARVALLEKVLASLLINRRDPFRRSWIKEIFRKENLAPGKALTPSNELKLLDTYWAASHFGDFSGGVTAEEISEFETLVSELATTQKLAAEVAQLRMDYLEMMTALSEADALAEVPMRRIVQASVYISGSSDEAIESLDKALPDALDVLDANLHTSEDPTRGSWFKKAWGLTRQAVTSDAVTDRASKLERAAEIKLLDGAQYEADLKAAKAVRELLKGFEGSDSAVALIGSVCVLKRDGHVIATTLSQEQLAEVRKNPRFLNNPALMERLLRGEADYEHVYHGNGDLVTMQAAALLEGGKKLIAKKKAKARKGLKGQPRT